MDINLKKYIQTIKDFQLYIISLFFILLFIISILSCVFIVFPMFTNHQNIEVITVSWKDNKLNDNVVDYVKLSIKNIGVSSITINNISVFVKYNNSDNYIDIENRKFIRLAYSFPFVLDVSVVSNFTINFFPEKYMKLGDFQFIIGVYINKSNKLEFLSKTVWKGNIKQPDIIPITPTNNSWISGKINPKVDISGGYLPSTVKGTFYYPNKTKIVSFDDISNFVIETIKYTDTNGYILELNVTDYINNFESETIVFGVDNEGIQAEVLINGTNSDVFQLSEGDSFNISISLSYSKSKLKSAELFLTGEKNGEIVLEKITENITNIAISSNITKSWGEDKFNLTLALLDDAGNQATITKIILVKDRYIPNIKLVSPQNGTIIYNKKTIDFVLYAEDNSGISEDKLLLMLSNRNLSTTSILLVSDILSYEYNDDNNLAIISVLNVFEPNMIYDISIVIYDNSSIQRTNSTSITLLIYNEQLILKSGVSVGLLSNDSLNFVLNNQLFVDLNLTKIRFRWENNTISNIQSLVFLENSDYILNEGLYLNNTQYLINAGKGKIIANNSSWDIILKLDFNNNEITILNIGRILIDLYIEYQGWQTIEFNILNGYDEAY